MIRLLLPGSSGVAIVLAAACVTASASAAQPGPVARYQARVSTPAWSPDGRRIAFVRLHAGSSEIFVVDDDGTNRRNVTHNPSEDAYPHWAPDGRTIVFTHLFPLALVNGKLNSGGYEICVIEPDGTRRRRLTRSATGDFDPRWSPDGRRIAFDRAGADHRHPDNVEVFVMNADGTGARRLTFNRANDGSPDWSPDGTRIAFSSNRGGNPALQFGSALYVMDADGKHQQRLTFVEAEEGSPAWSPDGKRLAFFSTRDGNPEIYVMNVDGTNQRRLTRNRASDGFPAWSPDGRRIAFLSTRDGGTEVYVMDADGRNQRRLTRG